MELIKRSRYISLRSVALALLGLVLLLALGVVAYAQHVRASASALISSASQIRSTADAERQIAIWRRQFPRGYEESRSPDGTGRAVKFEVRSGLLSTFHVVPSTGVSVQVSTRSGGLLRVVVGMYTEQSSVWVQEEFSDDSQVFRVDSQKNRSGVPMKMIVTLGSGTLESTRAKAFALNAHCLMKPGGCKSAEEMLSTFRQLESTPEAVR